MVEKVVIQNVLQETHWNRKEAAKVLRVSYKTLLYKIKNYYLDEKKGSMNWIQAFTKGGETLI